MADEFTPEASVDFEALAAFAAAEAELNGNGDGPHYTPPPETSAGATPPPVRPRATAPQGSQVDLDPFQALRDITRDQGLAFRELGDINAKLAILQLQTLLMFGAAMLLAVLVWKFARSNE